jgi:hypothetical protein
LNEAVIGELKQFLDADSAVPQHLDDRPSSKPMLLGPIQQYQLAGVGVASPDIAGKRVGPIDPGEGPSRDGERLPKRVLLTGGEQLLRFASPAVGGFDVGSEVGDWEYWRSAGDRLFSGLLCAGTRMAVATRFHAPSALSVK